MLVQQFLPHYLLLQCEPLQSHKLVGMCIVCARVRVSTTLPPDSRHYMFFEFSSPLVPFGHFFSLEFRTHEYYHYLHIQKRAVWCPRLRPVAHRYIMYINYILYYIQVYSRAHQRDWRRLEVHGHLRRGNHCVARRHLYYSGAAVAMIILYYICVHVVYCSLAI